MRIRAFLVAAVIISATACQANSNKSSGESNTKTVAANQTHKVVYLTAETFKQRNNFV